jgi:hypothetical protein
VERSWIRERVEQANQIFDEAGLSFETVRVAAMDEEHRRLDTRRDRHALGALVRPKVVNIFVVESLRDVDDRSRFRQGVHWSSWTHRGTHYVILSRIAEPPTLAHELGHFFGNPSHGGKPGNIMSYDDAPGDPFFNDTQIRRIHRRTKTYLRSGELVPLPKLPSRAEGQRREAAPSQ